MSGQMDIRGVYGFSSLMKQNKKAENYAVVCFAGFSFVNFFCYEVIVKQIFYKRSTNHYSNLISLFSRTTCLYLLSVVQPIAVTFSSEGGQHLAWKPRPMFSLESATSGESWPHTRILISSTDE